MPDRQRTARQLTRDIGHLLSAALRAAPVFALGRRSLRTAGLGIVLCFTALFRFLANAHPGQAIFAPSDAIVATQLTLIAISLPLIVLAALLSERRSTEQALRDGHSRYGLATIADNVGVWDWNLVTNAIYVDPSLKNILGFSDHESPTISTTRASVCTPMMASA